MYTFLVIVHVLCCIFLVAVVLLQVGRGRGMLGFLGSSTAETLFGSRTGDVLTRATTIIAALFMVTSLSLAYISLRKSGSITKGIKTKPGAVTQGTVQETTVPAGEDKVVQKGSELVEATKEKLKKKIPLFGTRKKSESQAKQEGGALRETTKSNIRHDEKGNKIIEEYKYDSNGKLISHKEVTKDKLDKVVSEKELPITEEKATVETPQ